MPQPFVKKPADFNDLGPIVDKNQDDFKDEDVPDEEGVVLPPRPPKRV